MTDALPATQSGMILVLGIGNLLWADEGFGLRAAEELQRRYEFDERVTVVDGGTQGLYLLPMVQEAEALLVFDAIDYGLPPGTLKVIEGDDVPSLMGAKAMSLHQTGFQDVLAAAELTGHKPSQLMLIGVQPEELRDFGGSLRESVRAQVGPAVELGVAQLRRWGVTVTPREQPAESFTAESLVIEAYEQGRPSEEEACRQGDMRFLARRKP
ncbi:MAG: HyaD/HybD family hydrogenase maturation endopeptidase [Gammaproteobacteria bacterium]|nr:HyaD/HybD family hydrogenase maturation endopeptidase [Gammaproteobacteria bacterium]